MAFLVLLNNLKLSELFVHTATDLAAGIRSVAAPLQLGPYLSNDFYPRGGNEHVLTT